MTDTARYAAQSDPDRNPAFRRRWSDPAGIALAILPDAMDAAGEARVALLTPRAPPRVFGTFALALAAKRQAEAAP